MDHPPLFQTLRIFDNLFWSNFLILSSLDFEDEDNLDLGLSGPQNNEAFLPDSLTFYDRPMTKYDDIRPVVLLQTLHYRLRNEN